MTPRDELNAIARHLEHPGDNVPAPFADPTGPGSVTAIVPGAAPATGERTGARLDNANMEEQADPPYLVAAPTQLTEQTIPAVVARQTGAEQPHTLASNGEELEELHGGPLFSATVKNKEANRRTPKSAKSQGRHEVSALPTSSAAIRIVDPVEGVEGQPELPEYAYRLEAGLDRNFRQLGKMTASLVPQLYRHPDGGLIRVVDGRPHHIRSATELGPLLIDHIRIPVSKDGKYHGERIPDTTLNTMLRSRLFLQNFPPVREVVTTAVALADYTPSKPGYNPADRVLYLGSAVSAIAGLDAINTFLDVMDWQSNADRTNAVAALLTVLLRFHFPGGKPFVLVTAPKSHSGKGTVMEFVRCGAMKADLCYQDRDWPMEKDLHDQLLQRPEIAVVCLDNVRTDSSGRAKVIRSSFLEGFVTNPEPVLSSASSRSRPIRTANRYVMLLNMNEGCLSIDLLNRALSIGLNPTGDLAERIANMRKRVGCDIKHEWLPDHVAQIAAEAWGMIERWRTAGMPKDESARHPMGPWATTVGGILLVNGFNDFLGNYSATRAAADPIRVDLGTLAFHAGPGPKRAGELAKLARTLGLARTLLAGADLHNEESCQRQMGVVLSRFLGETFNASTASHTYTYKLRKEKARWGGWSPHFRYSFEVISRDPVTGNPQGVVLEERAAGSDVLGST
jgi:hypothetical protein